MYFFLRVEKVHINCILKKYVRMLFPMPSHTVAVAADGLTTGLVVVPAVPDAPAFAAA